MGYIIPLLIGAAVPLITLFINRKFDLLNIGKSHDLSLSKEYFIKKLNAFEKGTSYYTIAHLSIVNMSMVLKTLNKENVDISAETASKMLLQIQKSIDDVYTRTQDVALALPLYTDLKLNDSDEELAEKYLELIGEINLIGNVIQLTNEKLDTEPVTQEMTGFEGIREDQILELTNKINELYKLSKTIKIKYKAITASLRDQLRIYDI